MELGDSGIESEGKVGNNNKSSGLEQRATRFIILTLIIQLFNSGPLAMAFLFYLLIISNMSLIKVTFCWSFKAMLMLLDQICMFESFFH